MRMRRSASLPRYFDASTPHSAIRLTRGSADALVAVLHCRVIGRKPAAVVAVRQQIELAGIAVILDVGDQLRVQHLDVVRLVEIVGDDLPVVVRLGRHVEHADHLLHLVRADLLDHGLAEIFAQRRGFGVHREPDQPEELFALHLAQAQLAAGIALSEVRCIRRTAISAPVPSYCQP